jgi:alpha-1,2-mannosyltransferase/arabinofuranan 3-O-arabinosyltransferase
VLKDAVRRAWIWLLVVSAVGVLLLSVGINVSLGAGTLERISTDSMDVHADFDTFWRSADAMWEGRDIYEAGARLVNLNPPFWTVLLAPFGLMEPLTAYRVFVLVSVFTTIGYLAWMADELRLRAGPTALAVGLLLLSSPLLATLALGQMYPVLALGLVAAWVFDRRDNPTLSGVALGLTVALKPSLAPIVLWPLVRRRWRALLATVAAGAAGTLVGAVVLGPRTTLDWFGILLRSPLSAYWDNASLPSSAARMFTENEFAEPIATLPWMVPLAYAAGVGIIILTAVKVRHDPEAGLWALTAASLLASPIAWHNYLVLLAPGILLLVARGHGAVALMLLALQLIPPQWPLLWQGEDTALATLALTLYLFILFAHWISFLTLGGERGPSGAFGAGGKHARGVSG